MKILVSLLFFLVTPALVAAADLDAVINGKHREPENSVRDQFRHPAETLEFFRVGPGMTVVEIWPGGGWYTEILAPYLKDKGVLYAAHFPSASPVEYYQNSRKGFMEKLQNQPQQYEAVKVVDFDPGAGVLDVPDNTADRVLTFRNVHNWLRSDGEQTAFDLFYKALKPGGMLGVVEHATPVERDRQWMLDNGYMSESLVIELAENAGFELLAKSDINANPEDSADHPAGVWTLPPRLRLGDSDREKYLAVGESNRMTLLFVKPTE